MIARAESEFAELLDRCGARPSGLHRRSCPDCAGKRTVSVDEEKQVFFCHHAGCGFRGGIGTLRNRLGITREWIPHGEYVRQRNEREHAEAVAQGLRACLPSRRALSDELCDLNHLEMLAHEAGPDHAATWPTLAYVYARWPSALAELAIMELVDSDVYPAAELIRFAHTPGEVIDEVLAGGGLYDAFGRFVEVHAS